MPIRSRMSLIMGLIGPEQPEIFALKLEKLLYGLCLHSSFYNCQQMGTKLGQIYMKIRSQMSLIMGVL